MINTSSILPVRVLALAASAVLATTAAEAQSVKAVADTYVQYGGSGTPLPSDTNYGADITFGTANDGGSFGLPKGGDRFSLIRFDLSLFSRPFVEGQVTLNLEKISGGAADFVVYAIADMGADEAFDEATYTFNASAYAATTSHANNDGALNKTNLVNLGTFSAAANADSISFTSSALVDFLNADTNNIVTFIIYQSTQDKAFRGFASREHGSLNGPTLSVSTIPEPTTYAAVLGGGFLGLTLLRRKVRVRGPNS